MSLSWVESIANMRNCSAC